MKKQLDGLKYKEAQKRNTKSFKSFPRNEQKYLRQKGYRNRGWDNVVQAWTLICSIASVNTSNMSNITYLKRFKLEKELKKAEVTGNPLDILDALEDITNYLATDSIKDFEKAQGLG